MQLKEQPVQLTKTKRTVPFFNYPYVFLSREAGFTALMTDVCRRGAFIMQRDLEEFERNLAAHVGVKHVVGMANATDALHLAVRAAGIGPGDEVIFSSHTMVATASAIYFAGATPVPVECGPDHLIDPASVAAAVTPRTKAVMPTQLNGRTCDMDALQAIADKHHLLIIEDAAQSLGSKFKGRRGRHVRSGRRDQLLPRQDAGLLRRRRLRHDQRRRDLREAVALAGPRPRRRQPATSCSGG